MAVVLLGHGVAGLKLTPALIPEILPGALCSLARPATRSQLLAVVRPRLYRAQSVTHR
jgi:hypothetical protein